MTSEARIKSDIRLALGEIPGVRIFNNPVGTAYTRDQQGKYTPIRMGLAVGSHDLIGFKSAIITPEMVGRKIAIFTSIEVKNETGRLREGQSNWMAMCRDAGALVGVARSVSDAVRIVEGGINGDLSGL